MEPSTTLFGSYRLLEMLGEGGMGCVWKAVDIRLERVVALKILKGGDETRRKALVVEAKTACQLHHPNIAVVFDAGEVDGRPYIAMEYVEGLSLAQAARGQASLALLLSVAIQAAQALHHAHQKGVVHRDIKPDNLVLTPEGVLKVLDFGVAKRSILPFGDTSAQGFTLTEETEVGISAGTPAYMSPEQSRGVHLEAASDQFSLGVVLFEMATGVHPFRQASLVETLHAILKEPPPSLARFRPDMPASIVQAFDRMLAKNPADRFPSMQDLARHLEGLSFGSAAARTVRMPSAGRLGRMVRRPWLWSSVAGVAVLAALAVVGLQDLGRDRKGVFAGKGRRVVAVLPVDALGLPPELAWVGRSLQDAMATSLVRRGDLLVLDRLRVLEVLGVQGDAQTHLRKTVRELGADFLVATDLKFTGGHLTLSVRLLKGERGEVAEQIQMEGREGALMDLEDQLSARIQGLMGGTRAAQAPGSRARQPRTRELYAKACELMERGQGDVYDLARSLFEEALAQEPDYAPAHAALGETLLHLSATGIHMGTTQSGTLAEQALQEARKAALLDPELAFAQRVLAQALIRQGDIPGARTAAQRAVALDPADHRALAAVGEAFAYSDYPGDHEQARLHYLRALELFPNDWFIHYRLAVLLQNEGRLVEAAQHADRARQINPHAEYAYLTGGISLLWMGQYPEAAERLDAGLAQVPSSKLLRATRAVLAHVQGDAGHFRDHLRNLEGAWPPGHPVAVLLAGLQEDMDGHAPAARARFQAFQAAIRNPGPEAGFLRDHRTLSVNLYHMARAAARWGDASLARDLLAQAEELQPGKRQVARLDPLLRNL